jgi:uncharacterized transporter YbjL
MAVLSSAKKFAWSLVALMIALIVLFFALAWLHSTFSGNVVGQGAGFLGGAASGQRYNYQ